MVLEVLDQVQDVETPSRQISDTVAQQVAEIVDEAEDTVGSDRQQMAGWHYRIPFAGVRYYSF